MLTALEGLQTFLSRVFTSTTVPVMEESAADVRRGTTWFFIAGLIAVGVSFGLFAIDHHLSTSDAESRHATELRALRTAQTSLAGGSVDGRTNPLPQ